MHNNSSDKLTASARLIASLLAAFFVLTALAGLILFNVEQHAFDPAAYKRALASGNFYQKFPYLLGNLLTRNISGNAPAFLQHISADQWKALLDAILPEQQLQAMTEDTLDQVFAYVNGEIQSPSISLVPLKNGLAGPAGLNAALTIIQSQPDCTIEQMARMFGSFGLELCNPPEKVLNLLHPVIQTQMQAAASAIPDRVPILQTTRNTSSASGIKSLKRIRLMMRLSPLVPFALLLGITLIAVRTLKGWLVWWGWPLMLTGLFGIPLSLAGAPLFRWIIERWLSRRITLTLPPEISAALREFMDAAMREILKPAVWESLALFIIGLAMILFPVYLTSREKKKVAASEAETQIFR